MLHYVHRLVSSCDCLPFQAEQVLHGRFLELLLELLLPAVAKSDTRKALRANQSSKVGANELKLAIKLCKAEGSCRVTKRMTFDF